MLNFDPTVNAAFGADASLTDASGQRLAISDRYADLLMRPKDDLLRVPWQAIAHPDDLRAIALPFNRMVVAGEPYQERCRMLRSDGQYVSLTFRVVRYRSEDHGRIIMQSQFRVDEPPPEVSTGGGSVDSIALAGYIRDMAQQLGHLADQRGMDLLQHLLAMVGAEAGEEIVRRMEVRRADERHRRIVH